MSINWYTKSQGPKKKSTHFTKVRIHSCLADTARNLGGFTTHALWSVQSFNSPTVGVKQNGSRDRPAFPPPPIDQLILTLAFQ